MKPKTHLTANDIIAAGACRDGVISWCEAHGGRYMMPIDEAKKLGGGEWVEKAAGLIGDGNGDGYGYGDGNGYGYGYSDGYGYSNGYGYGYSDGYGYRYSNGYGYGYSDGYGDGYGDDDGYGDGYGI